MMRRSNIHHIALLLPILLLLPVGCSVAKYIPEGETFYGGVGEINFEKSEEASDQEQEEAEKAASKVLAFKPNGALFGSAKVRLPFTYPFRIRQQFADATDPLGRWLNKSFGATPILLSMVQPDLRAEVGRQLLAEYGFFDSTITPSIDYAGDSVTAMVSYDVRMGAPHRIDSVSYHIPIVTPDSLLLDDPEERLLHRGDLLSVRRLERERQRIAGELRSRGYYYFTPTNIRYEADTMAVPHRAQLRVVLSDDTSADALRPWRLGRITYDLYDLERSELTDSLLYGGILFRYHKRPPVRLRFLAPRVSLAEGNYFDEKYQSATVSSLADLETFAYTNISYSPTHTPVDSLDRLDVYLSSMPDKPYAAELEATYRLKSNNQTGPGLALSLDRRNIFRGGETLSLRLQGNYEWQTGYDRSEAPADTPWDIDSYLFLLSTELRFPRTLLPVLYYRHPGYPTFTRLSLSSALLSRSGFYRQLQFAFDTEYRFEPFTGVRHTIRPLSITYNHLLRRTEAFDAALRENPGLSLSFRNQFIPQASYLFGFETRDPESRHTFSLEAYLSEAGNLLSLLYPKDLLPEASFAQFVKGSLELRYSYRLSPRVNLATRAYAGAIYSYGTQSVAPYTEQFYAGGANSLRGFNVRSVGPGAYSPSFSSPLAFLDRTGDLRLEANLELRGRLTGGLELAGFVDAGNVWLLHDDPTKPEATFRGEHFLRDVALSSGLGLRYDLSFLVIRLDLGVALHRPDRTGGRYFNTFTDRHNLPLALHLAVGYPF